MEGGSEVLAHPVELRIFMEQSYENGEEVTDIISNEFVANI